MKQQWIFVILGTLVGVFFASCTGFFDLGKGEEIKGHNENEPSLTKIYFDNTRNRYRVDVFSNFTRQTKIDSVSGNGISTAQDWLPTTEPYLFYLTYYLPIGNVVIPYISSEDDNAFVSMRIPKDVTTRIQIPVLPSSDAGLFDDACLTIKNNGYSDFRLFINGTPKRPENGDLPYVAPNTTALYKFGSNITLSALQIVITAPPGKPLPAEITAFEEGWLYEVDFDGTTATLVSSKLLTLNSL
jgi:hypothetical protein